MHSGDEPRRTGRENEGGEGRRQPSPAPQRAPGSGACGGGGAGGTAYRVVYSSDDFLSDGELHVERREGSISAWYQRGASPTRSTSRAGRAAAARELGAASDGDGEGNAGGLRSSVTVVVHDGQEGNNSGDEAGGGDEGGEGGGGVAVSKQELQDMISWETNNLFDYLKGLYQQGVDEAQKGQEFDSEELARRMPALRRLLRERDGEVQQLQRLLDDSQRQLEGRDADVVQQAQRIQALEERIRHLLRQLEAVQLQASSRGMGGSGELAAVHLPQKRALAAAYQPTNESYFVQLPAQSYAGHLDCGFWQSVTETVQHHPRVWAGCLAAFLLLLLIVLCATLVPAANRRKQRPEFLAPVGVAGTGATWIDLAVQLDRPALVSYMVFRQADLGQPVPGLDLTLLELIQRDDVRGHAVYAASAAAGSLHPGSGPQAGLQQLAVACGWGHAANGSSGNQAATVSVLSAAGAASAACTTAAAAAPGRCARCPKLGDSTAYTVLLVAASASGQGVSNVQLVNAVTGDASVNVNSLQPPFADNATATSVDLHFKLNTPGTLYYAIAYGSLFASYGAQQLAFSTLTPTSSAVMAANPAAFLGGLVANGSVAVADAGLWVDFRVQPPCVAALCQLSMYGLQGGTAYRIYLVAVDGFGNADPSPAVATFTTAPATSAPALLPPSVPTNISAVSFGMGISMDAAGGVYYLLVTPKPGASVAGADVAPGAWSQVSSLLPGGSRRQLAGTAETAAGVGSEAGSITWLAAGSGGHGSHVQRQLQQAAVAPGSLVARTCYPTNRTCLATPAAAFSGVSGLAANFNVVSAGCLPVPAAGQSVVLPTLNFAGLQNNTLYHLLLATEDREVPQPNRLQPPVIYAVRTVDLSAPQLACGFPVATNITATSFSLAAMLTKPGASVFFVVLPATAASSPPSAQEVLRGTAAGGAAATAAGNLTHWGSLPWEVAPAGGAADPRKLWAPVSGLHSGANYTVFFTVSIDGSTPAPGAPVATLSGVVTPNTVPPTFTRIKGLNASVDEARGTFSVQLSTDMDRAGQVYYALYRNYSCIQGEPSVADIVAGNALPPSICKCEDTSYCTLVTAGSYGVPAQALGGAVHSVGGDLSPLPFQSLANASDDQLKCFQGGLGQATDTYNIYLVAGNALPSYTGLAPQCSNFAQAAATAAAAAAGGGLEASCPVAPQLACTQAQLRPDAQTLQSGGIAAWPLNASSSDPVIWQPPAGTAVTGRPAKVQLSLEGGAAPAFTYGPALPAELRTAVSFGMQFVLDKPALLIYAVFRPMPIDSSGKPQAPVLISTGRVPVFDAAVNITTGAITACPWAPGSPMQALSQYFVTYVARDKYGRMDGLCPGQQPGAAPRVCTDIAFTGS